MSMKGMYQLKTLADEARRAQALIAEKGSVSVEISYGVTLYFVGGAEVTATDAADELEIREQAV